MSSFPLTPKNRYDEIFQVEMEGWVYGISNYPGEIYPELIFRIITELKSSFQAAIEHHVIFDVMALATMFSKAAKYLVHEKDIAFAILSQFSSPRKFQEDEQFIMAQIIDQVETAYGGVISRLEKKWRWELENEAVLARKAA